MISQTTTTAAITKTTAVVMRVPSMMRGHSAAVSGSDTE